MNTPNETIIARIKKLLALAKNNPNQAEREAAMAKAQELMLQYRVDQAALAEDDEQHLLHESGMSPCPKSRGNKHLLVATLCRNAADVLPLIGDTPTGRGIKFVGRIENTAFAETLYDWLLAEFDRQWKVFYAAERKARRVINENKRAGFYQGLYAGLMRKVRRGKNEFAEAHALILVDESDQIERLYKQRHPTGAVKPKDYRMHANSYQGGKEASNNVHLNKQVATPGGQQRRMLE